MAEPEAATDANGSGAEASLVKRLASVAVSIGLLGLALWFLDLDAVGQALRHVTVPVILPVFLILLLEFPVLGLRWFLLIKSETALGPYEQIRRFFVAIFFTTFTPAHIGADIYRFADQRREGAAGGRLVSLLLRERLLGLMGYLGFFLAMCVLHFTASGEASESAALIVWWLVGISALIVIGVPVGRWLGDALATVAANADWPMFIQRGLTMITDALDLRPMRHLAVLMALSVVGGSLLWAIAVFLVARGLGVDAPFALIGLISVMVELVRLVPLTVQGIGIREATFAYAFDIFGLGAEIGFVVGLVAYATVSVAILVIGALGYVMPKGQGTR